MCTALAGMLNPELGYFIKQRPQGFFSQRSKHGVPPDGHWRFIVLCAELAQNGLYISDICVPRKELKAALREAHHFVAASHLKLSEYNARDILNLKTTFGL